jgi:hypothetical protein
MWEVAVNDQSLKQRYVELLLDRVRMDQYPSQYHMDLIEATVRDPEQIVEYLEALIEKVEATRFPSISLLTRIQRIVAALPG